MITWQTDEKRLLHPYTKCTNMAAPHAMLPAITIAAIARPSIRLLFYKHLTAEVGDK